MSLAEIEEAVKGLNHEELAKLAAYIARQDKLVGDDVTLDQHRLAFRETFATTGLDTLKALLIVSGGAAVAYLAFLGNSFANATRFEKMGIEATTTLILAMQYYICSVALAVLAYGATYFSHGAFYFKFERAGYRMAAIAALFGLGCLGFFVYGSLEAAAGFRQAASSVLLKP